MNIFRSLLLVWSLGAAVSAAEILNREAKATLTALEMNRGDTLRFKLRNGQVRSLVLEDTSAEVLLTNLKQIGVPQPGGRTIYQFKARYRVDGHTITLRRYVSSQESFYEPYVINGMRIWLNGVREIFEIAPDIHGERGGCRMQKDARLAINDASDTICPDPLRAWCPISGNTLDILNSYNGDDPFLGAYNGAECHGGLDINHPKGTNLFAPIEVQDHLLFKSLAAGDSINFWRGIRRWSNGETWTLEAAHLEELLIPAHTPLSAGTAFAKGAGTAVGVHDHSHFVLKISSEDQPEVQADAWVLFWQAFEQRKIADGELRAVMAPLGPARTGEMVSFQSRGSRSGSQQRTAAFYWTFGDGGFSREENPVHVFAEPGIYPVTLTLEDREIRAATTQLMTVDGQPIAEPTLTLIAPDEVAFVRRKPDVLDVYGVAPKHLPHTLVFTVWPSRPVPAEKTVLLSNTGGATLPSGTAPAVHYEGRPGWLQVRLAGAGNHQKLMLRADAIRLAPGRYAASVVVHCPGARNSPQRFSVILANRHDQPPDQVTIDDADSQFYATPYFWVGPRFHGWKDPGFKGFYLTNGGQAVRGEFARFTPELREGAYEIAFSDQTPFAGNPSRLRNCPPQRAIRFRVRVRHKFGEDDLWVEPTKSRRIGLFAFDEGSDGFVEILAEGSEGQVIADAIVFNRVGPVLAPKREDRR